MLNNNNKNTNSNINNINDINNIYEFDSTLFHGQTYKLVPLSSNFEYEEKRNPHEKSIKEKRKKWLIDIGAFETDEILNKFINQGLEAITSSVYSFLEERELLFAVKIYDSGFILDDNFIEKGYFTKEKLDNYLNEKNPSKIGKIFWDIVKENKNIGHPGNLKRIVEENSRWLITSINANNNVYHSNITFEEYAEIRRIEVGSDAAVPIIMAGHDLYVTDEQFSFDEIKQLRYVYSMIAFLSNDYCSFKKEFNDKKMSNIVKIFALQSGNLQEAINKVYEKLVYMVSEFLRIHEISQKKYDHIPSLKVFLERIKLMLFATYYFHLKTARYGLKNIDL